MSWQTARAKLSAAAPASALPRCPALNVNIEAADRAVFTDYHQLVMVMELVYPSVRISCTALAAAHLTREMPAFRCLGEEFERTFSRVVTRHNIHGGRKEGWKQISNCQFPSLIFLSTISSIKATVSRAHKLQQHRHAAASLDSGPHQPLIRPCGPSQNFGNLACRARQKDPLLWVHPYQS